jgi:hypothetical protein
MKLPDFLVNWLADLCEARLYTKPDEEIGGTPGAPYMSRWHIVRLYPFFNIYLHLFHHSDDDRARHNHPWWSISVLLSGSYNENMARGTLLRKQGHAYARRASTYHRVELIQGSCAGKSIGELPVTTLFITGPKVRDWGFECDSGFRPWQKFMEPRGGDEIGTRGCD